MRIRILCRRSYRRYSFPHIFSLSSAGLEATSTNWLRPTTLVRAIRVVDQGLIWAPRRVLSTFIVQAGKYPGGNLPRARMDLTPQEKQVLTLLVEGNSNKEIAGPLGIEELTVKAHMAKMMHKVGVKNRIALSVHAVRYSLVGPTG